MVLTALVQLQRRKRQVDTLRRMLADVDTLLETLHDLGRERELKPDEDEAIQLLEVRRERILKSLDEATGDMAAPMGARRG